ncbi:hypothetical protein MASR1M60_14910 [Rhodocyclaceae bacterium]
MANNRRHWWHGLLARSLMALVGIILLTGGVSSLIISRVIGDREHQNAIKSMGQLLDTVESTASIACFANDEQLASEVAQGLLRNSGVSRVTIRIGDKEIVNTKSDGRRGVTDDFVSVMIGRMVRDETQRDWQVARRLISPFNAGESVGQIVIDADWAVIEQSIHQSVGNIFLLMSAQMMLVIAAVAATVLFLVVRPMKLTSDRLHHLNPASGDRLGIPEGHENSEIGQLVGDINDLTGQLVETLQQERVLRHQQEIDQRKYHDLFENASSGIFVCNRFGRLESWNKAFEELTWFPQQILAAEGDKQIIDAGWQEKQRLLDLLDVCLAQLKTGEESRGDFLLVGRRGDERWLHLALVALGNGSLQGTLTDVTQRKREELSAQRLAVTDSLTGFANRDGLHQMVAAFDKDVQPFAVLVIDLDGFKQINDAMGFPVGDQLLLMVAGRLREIAGESDLLARVGADEFIWILRNQEDKIDVARHAQTLWLHLHRPYLLSLQQNVMPMNVGATIGISLYPEDGGNLQELMRGAELALNSARSVRNQNGYGFYDPALQAAVMHRRRLEDDLHAAVAARDLQLYFQPIVDIDSGQPIGVESLLRWYHAERGSVPPDSFIPLAEEIGLIGEIGAFVLDEACRQVAEWRRNGFYLYASVNVSARQIPDGLPPAHILDVLKRHCLPPEAIVLEITEGVLMNNIAAAQTWIESLRAAGFRIYLDDFGTGYSSLSYLKRFPLDSVKIDKSFVRDMHCDKSDRALVDAIITMARRLDLKVVAEGIEEDHQLRLLRGMGCTMGQGYYFSRPVPAGDLIATIQRIGANPPLDAVMSEEISTP